MDKPEWAAYFDELTRRLEHGLDLEVTMETVGMKTVGTEAVGLPLVNITFDDYHDQIEIGVGGRDARFPTALWHYIKYPRLIWVHEHDGVPTAIAVDSDDNRLTLLRLTPPS